MPPVTLVAVLLLAQMGQYPQDPFPRGPGSGPTSPFPRRSKKGTDAEMLTLIKGWLRTVDAKTLTVEAADSRMIEFQIVARTKQPDKLAPGDYVEIDTSQDDKGFYTAVNVRKVTPPKDAKPPMLSVQNTESADKGDKPKDSKDAAGQPKESAKTEAPPPEPQEPPEPSRTIVKANAKYDAGDEPPRLHRGAPAPAKRKTAADDDVKIAEVKTPVKAPEPMETREFNDKPGDKPAASSDDRAPERSAAPPPSTNAEMALLNQSRAEAGNFLTTLPNYTCRQFTTRYEGAGNGRAMNWRAIDVVQADLVFEEGKERYEKLQINGKAVKGKMEDTGSWSTGEFGTVLADLFSPATAATFRFAGYNQVQRQAAAQYNFTVDREGSHWHIGVPGQFIQPSYKGAVWVAKDSARVLRIEMQATKVPKDFPMDTTEMAVDYDWITLGDTQRFLLPVKSEVLSCQRGTNDCTKNQIEFRNYHKFGAKSDVIFK